MKKAITLLAAILLVAVAATAQKMSYSAVNDGTLTIQKNGETVGTFTANQAGNTTVNITITAQDILDTVNSMTEAEKAALCSALNCGGSEVSLPRRLLGPRVQLRGPRRLQPLHRLLGSLPPRLKQT